MSLIFSVNYVDSSILLIWSLNCRSLWYFMISAGIHEPSSARVSQICHRNPNWAVELSSCGAVELLQRSLLFNLKDAKNPTFKCAHHTPHGTTRLRRCILSESFRLVQPWIHLSTDPHFGSNMEYIEYIEYIEYRFLQDNDIRLISFSAPSHHFPRQLWAVHQDGLSPHLFQSHRRFLSHQPWRHGAMARWRFKLMVGFFQPAQLPTLTAEDMASEQKNDERRKQRCGAAGILIW